MDNKKNPLVTLEMESGGKIEIELYPDIAPNTVRNFISLVQANFYNGLIFHRVIPGFMIQGGCPQGTGMGDPGYSIHGEFRINGFPNQLKHDRGILSMARSSNPNSAGSQFFIMVANSPHLDDQYAAFGRVISGLEIADQIVSEKTGPQDRPLNEQRIKEMTVETFGIEYEEVKKM